MVSRRLSEGKEEWRGPVGLGRLESQSGCDDRRVLARLVGKSTCFGISGLLYYCPASKRRDSPDDAFLGRISIAFSGRSHLYYCISAHAG